MDKKLFLVDGHSLIFRMYYAFLRRPMINSKGRDVSILFGFTKYVLDLIEREHPTHLAVCFDPPGKTFRHEMYPEYKGTRQATPELVIEALEPLKEICGALGIPVLMVPGFEGDDVLGSTAVQCSGKGFVVYMVTPDKDFGQLVSPSVFQYRPGVSGADNEILGPSQLCEKMKLSSPSQVIDLLTICGDSADNVPGVKGVGEVGASKLLLKYGTVENIYQHLDELSPKQAECFRAAQDHVALSKALVTIKTDIPLQCSEDDMLVKDEHDPGIAELFDLYEFQSLRKHLKIAEGRIQASSKKTRTLSWKSVEPREICAMAVSCGECAISIASAGDGIFADISNMALAVASDGQVYAAEGEVGDFRKVLCSDSIVKSGYNLKLYDNLLSAAGLRLGGKLNDVELMHYLINPEKSHKMNVLCRSYLDIEFEEESPEVEASDAPSLFDVAESSDEPRKDVCREAVASWLLSEAVQREMKSLALDKLYFQIEEPLLRVLSKMERNGVLVDMNSLREYADVLSLELKEIENRIRQTVGEPSLNVSSPKQIGELLYEKLQIDPRVRTRKDGRYPTDEETLLSYADANPVIRDILEFRGLKKLLGTYIEPFATWISPRDGRIHTTFNQTLTATGRLSSSRPNIQNIPVRTERGRQIRKAFVAPSDDTVIVSADYSQIELRLMAHFCQDQNMCKAFCAGKDVHAITASKIFKVPLEEVTQDMRRTAKTANFGIMYGISAFGLSQRLGITRVAAKKIIEDYFAGFPAIQEWIEKTREEAARLGYVQTLFGRRRYLPDINSRNATVRSLAERNAVNAPIQGTAADIIKLAMNRVDLRLRNAALRSRMVLQIHDELVFEAPISEIEQLKEIIKEEMENVIVLSVPLTVECNYGKNWLEAH